MITITKKVADNRLVLFPGRIPEHSYASNGHWAVRLSHVKNSALFETVAAASASFPKLDVTIGTHEQIDHVFKNAERDTVEYEMTPWVLVHEKRDYVLFMSADRDRILLDRVYATAFIEPGDTIWCARNVRGELYSLSAALVVPEKQGLIDWKALIMPFRNETGQYIFLEGIEHAA